MAAAGRSPADTGRHRCGGCSYSRARKKPPAPPCSPSSPCPGLDPPAYLSPGAEVEVRLDDDGFFGTWLEATVVGFHSVRGRNAVARYTVAFSHLFARKGVALTDHFARTHIRPRPPPAPPSASGFSPPRFFAPHDIVEAMDRDGWWSGLVVAADAAGRSVTVAFPITREVIAFAAHLVRPRRDYVDGEWVPSRAVIEEHAYPSPRRVLRLYDVGDAVEVWKKREVYGYSLFAATVTKVVDRFSYVVELERSEHEQEEGKAVEYLDWQHIRPAVEHSLRDCEFQLVPGTVVEVYCEGAWSPGIVHGLVGDGEYKVSVNSKSVKREVTKVVELIKPHYRWDGNRWSTVKPKRLSNLRERSASRKRRSSPIEAAFSGDKDSYDPGYSCIRRSRKEPQQEEVILAGGPEHVPVSEMDIPLSPSPESPENNPCLNPSSVLHGHSTPSNEPITTVDSNQELLPNIVPFENEGGKTYPMQAFQGTTDTSDDVHLQLKENSKSCSKETGCALSASLECQKTLGLTRQVEASGVASLMKVSTGTNSDSNTIVYTRKFRQAQGKGRAGTPLSSFNVFSTVQKRKRKEVTTCIKQSLVLEGTEFQTEVTIQKLTPTVPPGFELMHNEKDVDTNSDILHEGLASTINSIYNGNANVLRDDTATKESENNHLSGKALVLSLEQLVQKDVGNVNEESFLLGLQNAESVQCAFENTILRSCSAAESSTHTVSQISGHQADFVKSSILWPLIEAMDVFKKIPQQPHFRPLLGFRQALREGMALGLVTTFAKSVEEIRKSRIANSMALFEEKRTTLSHLEENGFSVQPLQNYLSRLVLIKTNNTRHLEERANLEAQIREKKTSLSGLNLLLDKNGKAIAELEKTLGELRHEGQKIAEDKELEDAELSRLEATDSNVEEACGDDEKAFGNVLAELQRKHLT